MHWFVRDFPPTQRLICLVLPAMGRRGGCRSSKPHASLEASQRATQTSTAPAPEQLKAALSATLGSRL
jgi:hypothetical protein